MFLGFSQDSLQDQLRDQAEMAALWFTIHSRASSSVSRSGLNQSTESRRGKKPLRISLRICVYSRYARHKNDHLAVFLTGHCRRWTWTTGLLDTRLEARRKAHVEADAHRDRQPSAGTPCQLVSEQIEMTKKVNLMQSQSFNLLVAQGGSKRKQTNPS